MKCPFCGAWSEVLESRPTANNLQRRARECGNGHRFKTYEVYQQTFNSAKRDIISTAKAMDARAARFKRDADIVRSFYPAEHEAKRYGITAERVRQIRRRAKDDYAKRKNVAGVRLAR